MRRAVFGTSDGGLVVGDGPFESRSDPPEAGVAFYRNDFALSERWPWFVPARTRTVGPGEALSADEPAIPVVRWSEPPVDPFAAVFADVTQAIGRGVIEKSVPVVTARGEVTRGAAEGLLGRLGGARPPLRAYGWIAGDEGVAGLSPEVLFRLEGRNISTMALAGTARQEERDAFAVDQKEIREHEFVAETLLDKLSGLGRINREARRILDLGPIVHFHSGFEVVLTRGESVEGLIRVLHPTPALGPLPRTEANLAQLLGWRETLGCPPWFGAPFGLWRDGVFEGLVAIRMISWRGSKVLIPSGCGIIGESRLVNEWRELRLKREAVRDGFGV